jgi:hypothetical protein
LASSIQSIDIAHPIQIALTPIFLISAIGATLNILTSRLARIVDRVRPANRCRVYDSVNSRQSMIARSK